jgi:hypothetical protein
MLNLIPVNGSLKIVGDKLLSVVSPRACSCTVQPGSRATQVFSAPNVVRIVYTVLNFRSGFGKCSNTMLVPSHRHLEQDLCRCFWCPCEAAVVPLEPFPDKVFPNRAAGCDQSAHNPRTAVLCLMTSGEVNLRLVDSGRSFDSESSKAQTHGCSAAGLRNRDRPNSPVSSGPQEDSCFGRYLKKKGTDRDRSLWAHAS